MKGKIGNDVCCVNCPFLGYAVANQNRHRMFGLWEISQLLRCANTSSHCAGELSQSTITAKLEFLICAHGCSGCFIGDSFTRKPLLGSLLVGNLYWKLSYYDFFLWMSFQWVCLFWKPFQVLLLDTVFYDSFWIIFGETALQLKFSLKVARQPQSTHCSLLLTAKSHASVHNDSAKFLPR